MVSLLTRRMACVVALLSAAATADAQSKRPMTIMDIMDLKNVGGVSLSPDGSKVAYTVNAWEHPSAQPSADPAKPDTAKGDKHETRSHIWVVPAAGGTPRQLTFSERGENGPQWSPDGRSLAFVSARGTRHGCQVTDLDPADGRRRSVSAHDVEGERDGLRVVEGRLAHRVPVGRHAAEDGRGEDGTARRSAGVRGELPPLARLGDRRRDEARDRSRARQSHRERCAELVA